VFASFLVFSAGVVRVFSGFLSCALPGIPSKSDHAAEATLPFFFFFFILFLFFFFFFLCISLFVSLLHFAITST